MLISKPSPPRSCQENLLFSAPCHVTRRPRFARATAFARPSASSCHHGGTLFQAGVLVPRPRAPVPCCSWTTMCPRTWEEFLRRPRQPLTPPPPLLLDTQAEGGCFGLLHAQINSDLQQRSPDVNQKMEPPAQEVCRPGSGSSWSWRSAETSSFNFYQETLDFIPSPVLDSKPDTHVCFCWIFAEQK